MKKIFAISSLMLVLAAPAFAGLDLGWNNCITDGGVADIPNNCGTFLPSELFGNFQLDNAVGQFVALDFSIDIQTTASPSGTYWNFGGSECNDGNLTLDDARFGSCLSALPTPCFATGAQCQNGFAWATQFTGPNAHRLVGSIFRDASAPVALAASQNYFAFKITFFDFSSVEAGGTCTGCTDPAAVVWNSAVAGGLDPLGGVGPEADEPIEGPGLVGNCASLNGGNGLCGATPTQNTTWGQVKSLYR